MIIDCIGCLHGSAPKLEGGDLLIVTGDLTARDQPDEYSEFFSWLTCQNYTHKILISGNHDKEIENGLDFSFEDERIYYLEDTNMEIEGFKIFGSPWTASFKGINPKCTAFTVRHCDHTDEILGGYWDLIPKDTDILITHGPPFGIFDGVKDRHCDCGYNCMMPTGSKTLLDKVLEIKPKLHVYSHIHEEGGQQMIFKRPGYGDENNTIFINCSIMNENYKPVNQPQRVILK